MPTSLDPYALAEQSAAAIALVSGVPTHDVAVILGTGLADAAGALGDRASRHDLAALAGLPDAFVPHQRSEVWSVEVGGHRVLAFLGRLHLYEGYSAVEVAHLVRTAVAAGCRTVVITNASGALDPDLAPGDVVLITDHLNLTGVSPLTGLAAGGCNLIAFTTGRGSAIGFPSIPVLKISSNTSTYKRMIGNMDINAGRIADGAATIQQVGQEIFDALVRIASGERTLAEKLGHHEFAPWRIGPVM